MLKRCKIEKTRQEILKAQLEDKEFVLCCHIQHLKLWSDVEKSHLRSVCVVPVGVVHLVWNLHQFRWSSDQQMNRTTALWISLVDLLKDKHICVCCFTRCAYGLGHPTTSSSLFSPILDRVCLDFLVDPVDVMCDTGVHPGRVFLPAPVTPADHAHQSHPAIVGTDQWATGVSL